MKNNSSAGFIRLIVIVIVVIILLAYFKVNLREIWQSDSAQSIWETIKVVGEKLWDVLLYLWTNFIREPALWIWEKWILGWVWPLVSEWFESQKTA